MTSLGNIALEGLWLGNVQAKSAWLGDKEIWNNETPQSSYWGLCFTAEEPNASISMRGNGTSPILNLLYSTDSQTWSTFTPGTTVVSLANIGDKMWLKAGSGGNSRTASSLSDYWQFSFIKHVAISGNIMSLLNGEQKTYQLSNYAFAYLFSQTNIVHAAELQLPATQITANSVYYSMFYQCSQLVSAPDLPAEVVTGLNAYSSMFEGCTSLVQAPQILATTINSGQGPMQRMFAECYSLTTAPVLQAMTLGSNCYQSMFRDCTSLVQAPELQATTLRSSCYAGMFQGCTRLTAAPALPAMTLAQNCYESMFQGCTRLTAAPALPAMTLAKTCYRYMFSDCYSLTAAPALPATNISSSYDCYNSMFYNCVALATPPAISAVNATNAYRCFQNMFYGCTSLSSSPTILVTDTADDCYYGMFENCTGLLSANDIAYAYTYGTEFGNMFANCTSIENMSFSQWSRSNLVDMFQNNTTMFSNVDASRVLVDYSDGAEWLSSLLPKTEIEGVKFTNVDLYGNTATVQITDVGDASSNGGICDLAYSTDGQNWNTYNLGDVIYLQSQNDYVIFKANGSSGSGIKSVSDSSYYKFIVSQDNVLVEGNLAYLFSNDPVNNYMEGDYQFSHLFENCSFVAYSASAAKFSSLKMPEEHTWAAVNYSNVFQNIFANATLARITIPVDSAGWTNGWSAGDAYTNWVYGISDGGQSGLMTLPSYFSIEYSDSAIPSSWSYETTN